MFWAGIAGRSSLICEESKESLVKEVTFELWAEGWTSMNYLKQGKRWREQDVWRAWAGRSTLHLGMKRKPEVWSWVSLKDGTMSWDWRGIWSLLVKVKIREILSQEQLETIEGFHLGEWNVWISIFQELLCKEWITVSQAGLWGGQVGGHFRAAGSTLEQGGDGEEK